MTDEMDALAVELAEEAVLHDLPTAYEFLAALFRLGYTIAPPGSVVVPREPTEAMLNAARDWSLEKYGVGVGNDGATGCYRAMIAAAEKGKDDGA